MANIAQFEVECYISTEAECQMLYFMHSMWQGNDLSVIKIFLTFTLPPLNIPNLLTLTINYIVLGQNWACSNTLLSYAVLKGLRKPF